MFRIPRDILIGFVLVLALALALFDQRWARPLDLSLYDAQVRWLRTNAPTPTVRDVVVIGLDEEAFEDTPEPVALWHQHLGLLFSGLAEAKPAAVGLAIPLPVRSYNFLVPNIDDPLIAGMQKLRATAPLVVGQPRGIGGKLRPIAPEIRAAADIKSVASLTICEDSDGIVRRVNQRRCRTDDNDAPLAFAMARTMGREGSLTGMIDYSIGSQIEYTPLITVLGWIRRGEVEALRTLVQGRAVIVANLLPTETRFRMPVPLAAWEPGSRSEPGAVVHAQTLRSLLGRGLITRVPETLSLILAGLAALLWFGRNDWKKSLLLLVTATGLLGASTFALWHGNYLPTASVLSALLIAFAARWGWDWSHQYRERKLLRSVFAGHVSPKVMQAILGGSLRPDGDGQRCKVTLLQAGIREFSARSAAVEPEHAIDLLNRFYAEATSVVQKHGGSIDKYVGDGLLATFGLPQPLPAQERNALEAAQELLTRIARLNTELRAESLAPIQVGIGIHTGEVLSGYVGTTERRDFTVIGDAAQTVEALEKLTKQFPYPIICSLPVAAAVGFGGGLAELAAGAAAATPVWGWQPALLSPTKTR